MAAFFLMFAGALHCNGSKLCMYDVPQILNDTNYISGRKMI